MNHKRVSTDYLTRICSNRRTEVIMSVNNRRKFLSLASKGAPVVAMVSSKSVWSQALSLSGALSNHVSSVGRPYELPGTKGQTPGFWKQHPEAWPHSVFPGIMVFSSSGEFKIEWTWRDDKLCYGSGQDKNTPQSCASNKDALAIVTGLYHNLSDASFGYATTWETLGLSGYGFLTKKTVWESLIASNVDEAEYHFAAAYLNAAHPSVDYGYTVDQLLQFLQQAIDAGLMDRFVGALVDLNEREHVDAKMLEVITDAHLVKINTNGVDNPDFDAVFGSVVGNKEDYPDYS